MVKERNKTKGRHVLREEVRRDPVKMEKKILALLFLSLSKSLHG